MRILLMTQWFPPEPQELYLELAVTLKELGHEVTVLTGLPNYPSGKLQPGYKYRLCQSEIISGVRVIRVPLYPDHSSSGVHRALNFVSFALSAALIGPFVVPRVDVVHVVHPVTLGVAAWLISRWQRIPFTYEIQDLWPETLAATGMVRFRWLLRMMGVYVKWVYSRAAKIRVISPGFRRSILAKGVPDEKIHVISNWVDPKVFPPIAPDEALRQRLGFAGRFVVVYAGAIGAAQGLNSVLEAAAQMQDLPDVLFAIFGDGIEREALSARVQERKLENVRFYGRWPATEMPGIFAVSSVLLIHLKDDPLFRITIPHKTFVYLSAGKPILAATAGDVADVIEEAKAGVACAPGNPEELAAAVRKLRMMSDSQRQELGRSGRRAAEEKYERTHLVARIAAMLEAAIVRK